MQIKNPIRPIVILDGSSKKVFKSKIRLMNKLWFETNALFSMSDIRMTTESAPRDNWQFAVITRDAQIPWSAHHSVWLGPNFFNFPSSWSSSRFLELHVRGPDVPCGPKFKIFMVLVRSKLSSFLVIVRPEKIWSEIKTEMLVLVRPGPTML